MAEAAASNAEFGNFRKCVWKRGRMRTRRVSGGVLGVDIVVSNPPWGKRFGKPEDSEPIVRAVVSGCRGATMVWLVNKTVVCPLFLSPLRTVPPPKAPARHAE